MKIQTRTLVTCFAFTLCCLTIHSTGFAQEQRSVSVTGTVIARVQPDTITWSIQVNTENAELAKAKEENDALIKQVLGLREALEVNAEDMQTGSLNIRKVYEQDQNRNRGAFRHYSIRRSVIIKQSNIEAFDNTFAKLTSIKNIEFSHQLSSSKFHEVRIETRVKALEVAEKKAREMVETLGATLGHVLSIEESKGTSMSNFASNSAYRVPADAPEDVISGTFAPGSISIRVSVDVKFAIE